MALLALFSLNSSGCGKLLGYSDVDISMSPHGQISSHAPILIQSHKRRPISLSELDERCMAHGPSCMYTFLNLVVGLHVHMQETSWTSLNVSYHCWWCMHGRKLILRSFLIPVVYCVTLMREMDYWHPGAVGTHCLSACTARYECQSRFLLVRYCISLNLSPPPDSTSVVLSRVYSKAGTDEYIIEVYNFCCCCIGSYNNNFFLLLWYLEQGE